RRLDDRGRPAPAAPDLWPDRDRSGLLRIHPAQEGRGIRRGQFHRAVQVDGTRPDPPRRARGGKGLMPAKVASVDAYRQALTGDQLAVVDGLRALAAASADG